MPNTTVCAIALVVCLFSGLSAAQANETIVDALIDFYWATSGPSYWSRKDGWGAGASYCNWYGITCDNYGNFDLALEGNTLIGILANDVVGTIPESFGNIGDSITSLLLDRNRIYGTIPQALTYLTSLEQFDISQNNMTGTIPYGFGNLTELKMFWLLGNNFYGGIPTDLAPILAQTIKFQGDQGCRLGGNDFCCPVPKWVPAACGMGCNATEPCGVLY